MRICAALVSIGLLAVSPVSAADRAQPAKKNPPAARDDGGVTGPSLSGSQPAPAKPKSPPAKPGNDKAAKPAADDSGWNIDNSEATGIILKSWADDVMFPSLPSDLVLVNNTVYNVRSGEQVGEFRLPKENIRKRTLSPDGKYLAVARNQQGIELIEIYEWDKAAPNVIPWKEKVRVEGLHFVTPTRLLAWMDGKKTHLITWDVEKNKVLRDHTTPVDGSQESAVSPSGKMLVVPDGFELAIVDVASGKRVSRLNTSKKEGLRWNFLTGLAFSPDEKELGAVFGNRLLVWSNRGKIIFDQTCTRDIQFIGRGARGLSWFPNGKAWLLGSRTILDRESRMFVYELPFSDTYARHAPAVVLDDTHVLSASESGRQGEYRITTVPWDEIRQAVAAALADKDPVIGPGHPLSIEVNLGQLRFAQIDQVGAELHTALKERLEQFGIRVQPGQSSVIRIEYAEAAGQTKEVVTGTPFARQRTGINLTESRGTLRLTLTAEGSDTPYWESSGNADAAGVIRGDLTDAQLRKEMFERIIMQIDRIAIPNYIPRDPKGVRLPIVAGEN
jgi:hypothetical protein